jgi:hypothetical protein
MTLGQQSVDAAVQQDEIGVGGQGGRGPLVLDAQQLPQRLGVLIQGLRYGSGQVASAADLIGITGHLAERQTREGSQQATAEGGLAGAAGSLDRDDPSSHLLPRSVLPIPVPPLTRRTAPTKPPTPNSTVAIGQSGDPDKPMTRCAEARFGEGELSEVDHDHQQRGEARGAVTQPGRDQESVGS